MKNRIKELRYKRQLTQAELARISGVPQTLLSLYERHQINGNILDNFCKLAKALNYKVDKLLITEDDCNKKMKFENEK